MKDDLRSLPSFTKARILTEKIVNCPLGARAAYEYLMMLTKVHGGGEPAKVMTIVTYKLKLLRLI